MTDGRGKRLAEAMADFARERISGSREPAKGFPREIWAAMGRRGLLDPERASHRDRCLALTRTARAMTEHGGDLGLTLSWMIHHLTAGVVAGQAGGFPSREALIPSWGDAVKKIKTGEATLSLAVSEPEGGGHPKFLTTRADRDGDGWVINGEKAYLTNGPVASAFIVIAVTGETAGKKAFSAFLVGRESPGLTVLPAMELPFFTSSPHGGIRLDGCRVSADTMVGEEGRAFPDLVLKFREMEDALMTGAVTGSMSALLAGAGAGLSGRQRGDDACLETLGRLVSMNHAAGTLSDRAAEAVDMALAGQEGIHLFFRDLASRFFRDLEQFCDQQDIRLSRPCPDLMRDLKASSGLGETVSRIRLRKLGQRLAASPHGLGVS